MTDVRDVGQSAEDFGFFQQLRLDVVAGFDGELDHKVRVPLVGEVREVRDRRAAAAEFAGELKGGRNSRGNWCDVWEERGAGLERSRRVEGVERVGDVRGSGGLERLVTPGLRVLGAAEDRVEWGAAIWER